MDNKNTQVEQAKMTVSPAKTRSFETIGEISGLIRQHYKRLHEAADRGEPIAYVMVGYPQEILRAMKVNCAYTENYAAVCASKQAALPFLNQSESDGFSRDLCSYAQAWIGYTSELAKSKDPKTLGAPWGGLPKPSFLLGRGQCEAGYKGYQCLSRYLDLPMFVYDSKLIEHPTGFDWEDKEVQKRHISYVKGQIQEAVTFLEKVMGKKINWDDVSEAIQKHRDARNYWHEIHKLRKNSPCPIGTRDIVTAMFPLYFMLGTQEAVDMYRKLYYEVKSRADGNIGTIQGEEKYRLMWGGIAQWHNLAFFTSLEEAGAVFVIDHYYRDAYTEVDASDPLDALAKRHYWEQAKVIARARNKRFGDVGDGRTGLYLELAQEYGIDGVIFHLIKTCRPISVGWINVYKTLREKLDLPTYLLEGDIVDSRQFDEEQTRRNVASFVELMASRKEKK